MSQAQTVWHVMEARRRAAVRQHWLDVLLAACLLSMMAASEVVFLNYVADPDSVSLVSAAEGIRIDD